MKERTEGVWIIDAYHDVTHSPDDGGWYITGWNKGNTLTRTSQIFKTKTDAHNAFLNDKVEWGKWD